MSEVTIRSKTISINPVVLFMAKEKLSDLATQYGLGDTEIRIEAHYIQGEYSVTTSIGGLYNKSAVMQGTTDEDVTAALLQTIPIAVPSVPKDAAHMMGYLDENGLYHDKVEN